jgi:hypothetical protein
MAACVKVKTVSVTPCIMTAFCVLWFMTRIAEKLEFMTGRAVEACTKADIGRKTGHKKTCFHADFQ